MISRFQIPALVILAAVALPAAGLGNTTGVAWRDNLDAAKVEAAQTGRLLLIHFWTRSCAPCKVLDQNVLSQPQVGAAVERDYVPVKVDADASPALAHMFRIDRVPTEVVLTPQGNVVATLSTPDNPDAYVAQLQNLARHFRQTTPAGGSGAPEPSVNAAYAALSTRAAAVAPAAQPQTIMPQAQPRFQQNNPYLTAPPTTGGMAVGQTVAGLAPTVQTPAGPPQVFAPPVAGAAGLPAAGPPLQGPPQGAMALGGAPSMPNNAMPRSYRDPMFAGPPAPAGLALGAPGGAMAGATGYAPAVNAPTTGTAANAPSTIATSPSPPSASDSGGNRYAANPTATNHVAVEAPNPVTAASPATQVAAAPAPVRPTQPALPANCPPVAFDGCCPVTLKTLNSWTGGSTAFGAIHRGRTYLFVGEQQRQQFLADPDAYSPVFAGYDPVLLLDKQQSAPGTRKYGFRYGGSCYLFSSQATMEKFQASPQTYAAGVRQAMAKVDAAGSGTILR